MKQDEKKMRYDCDVCVIVSCKTLDESTCVIHWVLTLRFNTISLIDFMHFFMKSHEQGEQNRENGLCIRNMRIISHKSSWHTVWSICALKITTIYSLNHTHTHTKFFCREKKAIIFFLFHFITFYASYYWKHSEIKTRQTFYNIL